MARPSATLIHSLFERQAAKLPNNIAIIHNNRKITYDNLHKISNQFANFLKANNINPGDLVAIYLKRSIDAFIAIMGIIKCGATYVPLNIEDPILRIKKVLNDSIPKKIICQNNNVNSKALSDQYDCIDLDKILGQILRQSNKNISTNINSNMPIYIIYTSGSTGNPKGVIVTHKNVHNYIKWFEAKFKFNSNSRINLSSAISFDMAITSTLLPLCCGGSIAVCDKSTQLNQSAYFYYLYNHEITHLKCTPSYFHLLLVFPGEITKLKKLKWIILGGESIIKSDIVKWLSLYPDCKIVNEYGPTETTVAVMAYTIDQHNIKHLDKTIPIGELASNNLAYILDKHNKLCKDNKSGELCIAGLNVAKGYLNNPNETRQKFIKNIYDDKYLILYKTGDLAYKNNNGIYEFIGRIDEQIKIRGYRIELEEIRSTINKYYKINNSIVIANKGKNHKTTLTAYLVPKNADTFNVDKLDIYLRKHLPDYMQPSFFSIIDKIPLNSSGKIDKKLLVRKNDQVISILQKHTPATTEVEYKLVHIFAEVLELESNEISTSTSFFDIGGDSLSAAQVITRVEMEFNIAIDMVSFMKSPYISKIAKYINHALRKNSNHDFPKLEIAKNENEIPVSYPQQRLWFLAQLAPKNPFYYIPTIYYINGHLSENALEKSLKAIISRHEILRTRFVSKNSQLLQQVIPLSDFNFKITKLDVSSLSTIKIDKLLYEEARKPFDFNTGPLVRILLLKQNSKKYILLTCMHHIVTDGWSNAIFNNELRSLYTAYVAGFDSPLLELPIQYFDFAIWQRHYITDSKIEKQIAYWKQKLCNLPTLRLPIDKPRPSDSEYNGKRLYFTINKKMYKSIKQLAHLNDTTIFTIIMSCFNILLYKYTGQDDIVIGSPVANRKHSDIEKLIGFFANTLVLRSDLSENPTFTELISRNKQVTTEAFSNQDIPFEKLVAELQPERVKSINPLFQVMLTLEPMNNCQLILPGLQIKAMELDINYAIFDITILLQPKDGKIYAIIEYNTDIFLESTIKRFIKHFKATINYATSNPTSKISEISILTKHEQNLILNKWNNTDKNFNFNKTIVDLINQQAALTPNNTAVRFGIQNISYTSLIKNSNCFARKLLHLGIKKNDFVGICMNRSIDLVITIISVLKIGCAYVPIDVNSPQNRIQTILDDGICCVILKNQQLEKFTDKKLNLIIFNSDDFKNFKHTNLDTVISPNAPIYTIYTSGTTGLPNGVVNIHKALVNRLLWMKEKYKLASSDKILQKTPYTFDVSVWEFFLPLISGAELVVMLPNAHKDPKLICDIVKHADISIMHFVPSMLEVFLNYVNFEKYKALKHVICSGEILPYKLQQRFFNKLPHVKLHNLYGPTEAAIDVSFWECQNNRNMMFVPIGKPISNIKLYIFDKNMNLLPPGISGELHIGGVGLANGYLNRTKLTARRFVFNPLNNTEKLYKTGDLARWLPNGIIEYIGRIDNQIKIHGNRIELEEIENVLNKNPLVKQTLATVFTKDDGIKLLAAYIIPNLSKSSNKLKKNKYEWEDEQIQHWLSVWQTIYDIPFGKLNDDKNTWFNITGWNSSYTDKPIPIEEMQEWVANTVERILELQPKNVLEIGCGTGLLLFNLAKHCQHYYGTDFSFLALDQVERNIDKNMMHNITLIHRGAHEIPKEEWNLYDTVVINSVIQYFPSVDYLIEVLNTSIKSVQSNGHVFIGDVRHLGLLELFHETVQLYKIDSNQSFQQWKNKVKHYVDHEKELLVDPTFFIEFANLHPRISHINIELKQGTFDNEMTKFRYDVTLCVETRIAPLKPKKRYLWNSDIYSLDQITKHLSNGIHDIFTVNNTPNVRLAIPKRTIEDIKTTKTLGNRYKKTLTQTHNYLNPNDLWKIAYKYCYRVIIKWSNSDSAYSFDAIFYKQNIPKNQLYIETYLLKNAFNITNVKKLKVFTNEPIRMKYRQQLTDNIREQLKKQLPDYMIPSTFIFSNTLPTNKNGKLDRKKLPQSYSSGNNKTYVSPANDTEKELSKIWGSLLELDRIGVTDNFFDLGGHSLLAIQVICEINNALNTELSVKDFFNYPTIKKLSNVIRTTNYNNNGIVSEKIIMPILIPQTNTTKTPLFLIHPIIGTVLWYQNLVKHFKGDRIIYAIQDPGLTSSNIIFSTIEEMAKYYLTLIQQFKPNGPYLLGGASFGGTVAVEIAYQLRQRGEEVKLIALFDSWAKHNIRDEKTFKQEMLEAYSESTYRTVNNYHEKWSDLQWKRAQMLWRYTSPNISEKIALFKARDPEVVSKIEYNYWDNFTDAKIVSHLIPGTHNTIFTEPNIEILARKLHKTLFVLGC